MSERVYGSTLRRGYRFGFGEYKGPKYGPIKDENEHALMLGWSNGCPIVRELTSPDSPYSLEWMLARYKETNQYFTDIRTIAIRHKFSHLAFLSNPQARLYTEPVGSYEPESVPTSYPYLISPMTGIFGYGSSRVAKEMAKKSDQATAMYEVLKTFIATTEIPTAFLAKLSETATEKYKVDPINDVLPHAYAAGVLAEQNCRATFYNVAQSFSDFAPTVWKEYESLKPSERLDLGIAEKPTFGA